MTMRKEDWLRLAMPASITLLALSVLTAPMLVKAQLDYGDTIYVRQQGSWDMNCN